MLTRTALLAVLLAGCATPAGPDALRRAWLVDALYDENRVWMSRDPALLAEKYRVMAADPYDFVRGAVGVFLADLARAGTDRRPTAFLQGEAVAAILLVVDPHPENVGTFLPIDGPGPTDVDLDEPRPAPLLLEINDFDGAAFGPYLIDVRRAMLGLATAIAPACDRACRDPILERWAEAYTDEIDDIDDGEPEFDPAIALDVHGAVTDALLVEALREGAARERLEEWTAVTAGGRRFFTDPTATDGLRPLTVRERAQLDRLLAAYPAPRGFRVLDRARRFGGGVASLPAIRYVVAFDRGDPSPADDEMIELREVVDPPVVPGLRLLVPPTFDDQPDRAVEAARALWARPDADPRLAGLADGVATFKVLTESSFHQAFDHRKVLDDVASDRFDEEDLENWAELLGRQLASVHARSVTADGRPALPALVQELEDREDAFVHERIREAEADLAAALRDHRLLVAALDDLGPLLGADR